VSQPANWTNSKMNPWVPDDNPHQARRIGKTGEEVNELGSVLFRITIQGIDSIDPSSGKTNRQRLLEESADVYAQLEVNFHALYTVEEQAFVSARVLEKRRQMAEWEAHYPAVAPPPAVAQQPKEPMALGDLYDLLERLRQAYADVETAEAEVAHTSACCGLERQRYASDVLIRARAWLDEVRNEAVPQ
jgi:hypothetical protein